MTFKPHPGHDPVTARFERANRYDVTRDPDPFDGPYRGPWKLSFRGKFWLIYGAILFGSLMLVHQCAQASREDWKPRDQVTELPSMPPDNAGGRQAHVFVSALIGTGTNLYWPNRPVVAFGACMLPGVVKEIHDYDKGQAGYKNGLFSRKDLLADAVGCGIGYGTAKGVRWMIGPRAAYLSAEF